MERKRKGDWFLREGTVFVDRIPANVEEQVTEELVALAKRAVNAYLDGKAPQGI